MSDKDYCIPNVDQHALNEAHKIISDLHDDDFPFYDKTRWMDVVTRAIKAYEAAKSAPPGKPPVTAEMLNDANQVAMAYTANELVKVAYWPILEALELQAAGDTRDAGFVAGKVISKLLAAGFVITKREEQRTKG